MARRIVTEGALERIERILDRTETRLLVGSLIVLSVLPFSWTPTLERVLLPVFALELTLRVVVLARGHRLHRDELTLLAADAVALATFLPIEQLVGHQVLRLLRLARLVVLARFFRAVLGDLRQILSRRQIRYQLGFLFVTVILLTLIGGTILSTFQIRVDDFDNDGRPDRGTADQVLWWTFRQIEDPGNLVEDSHGDVILLVTSLVLTIAGVFVMSFIIGLGASVVGALVAATRRRRVHLRAHTVVVGGGRNVRDVLQDLVEMYGKNRRRVRIAVLGDTEAPPPYVEQPGFRGVEYRQGEPTSLEAHELLATDLARRVIVLNDDERGESADAYAISSVLAVRQMNEQCPVVVDMHHRRYLQVAAVAGGGNITPVPMGKFLGCLMSQNLMYPGIDTVFEELLTARGSEIYTHIFSAEELEALAGGGLGAFLDFRDALLQGYRRDRVILLGAFLGADEWTDDVGRLTLWLNPLAEPPEHARALGAQAGRVPVETLRGLVAIAPEYWTLRRAAQQLAEGDRPAPAPTRAASGLELALTEDMLELRRILVLGDNDILPAMVENAADFVNGVEVTVVVSDRHRASELAAEFRRRDTRERSPSFGVVAFELPGGGKLEVLALPDDLLASLDHPALRDERLDVIVLLADQHEADPDAGTALLLLRLLERHDAGAVHGSERLRVVAEVLSAPKGELLERRLERGASVPVRLVPTRRLRSYFLVACAYVPGLEQVHLELLTPRESDFCQLRFIDGEGDDREMSFAELLERFSQATPPVVPFAVRLGPTHACPGLVLNPEPDDSGLLFRPSDVEALYAVGETERFDHGKT